ncbi:transcriptional regulator [Frankia sp. EI5c]|uniref:TetR/AcrR family transcriptional regulator n=1 Tax=Frankia sp. EI5c TaxID=683316 RepID=UPI0007C3A146|nr:TetR/AcrR family transcriptional regulator [Frankia sp. EI5c]OAA25836.1 transcriptional regulator [Frankia sp. EI5c]
MVPPNELSAPAGPKRQERGRRRAESILDAAEQVISEVGYDPATTNLIAARAGVSPGSLYQYFANKQAIAEALARRYVSYLGEAGDSLVVPGLALLPTAVLVDRVVDPLLAFNLAHPAIKALLAGAGISAELAACTRSLQDDICDRVEALIGEIAPHRDAAGRRLAAKTSFHLFTGVLPAVVAAGPDERPGMIRELKAAITGYWNALRLDPLGAGAPHRA